MHLIMFQLMFFETHHLSFSSVVFTSLHFTPLKTLPLFSPTPGRRQLWPLLIDNEVYNGFVC